MTFSKEFIYNANADYKLKYNYNKFLLTYFSIYVNQKDIFIANIINIFNYYPITFNNESEFKNWKSKCDMKYWQNQLNFVVYCSAFGCGVSLFDHLVNPMLPPLAQSFFLFHFLYQTRKILTEMKCPIHTNQTCNNLNNFIDMTEYSKICNEFNIDPNSEFRLKLEINNGAGYIYDENNKKIFEEFDPNKFSFEHPAGYKSVTMWGSTTYGTWSLGVSNFGGNWITHVNFIAQSIDDGWTRFMLEKSDGFLRVGIKRINDSN